MSESDFYNMIPTGIRLSAINDKLVSECYGRKMLQHGGDSFLEHDSFLMDIHAALNELITAIGWRYINGRLSRNRYNYQTVGVIVGAPFFFEVAEIADILTKAQTLQEENK